MKERNNYYQMIDYEKIYKIIGELTPIKADCGALCQKACCVGDSDAGMYLYPGEEKLYNKDNGFGRVRKSDFSYSFEGRNRRVLIFICDGTCDRERRPLACRVFPFVPYIDGDGKAEIIIDSRAEIMCPLAVYADDIDFDDEFLDRIAKAFEAGLEHDEFTAFVKAHSELIDEFESTV